MQTTVYIFRQANMVAFRKIDEDWTPIAHIGWQES